MSNSAFEIVEAIKSPQKRKRYSERFEESPKVIAINEKEIGITNAAFSSTPKKNSLTKRTGRNVGKVPLFQGTPKHISKQNANVFQINPCLEVKSIIDIAQQKPNAVEKAKNPFEVSRKPPKKKIKKTELQNACFVNAALNLEMPEKQFNPFEVFRDSPNPATSSKCFTNAALNIRAKDVANNPFEIPRSSSTSKTHSNSDSDVKTVVLQEAAEMQGSRIQIGLPFTPNVGCRIDFKNMPLNNLTPCKLLAEKLVFSPITSTKTPKSLSTISEETMDIGRELDLYQLELENSINEAKLRKANEVLPVPTKDKIKFSQRLVEIMETEGEKDSDNQIENTVNTIAKAGDKTENDECPDIKMHGKASNQTDDLAPLLEEEEVEDEPTDEGEKEPIELESSYHKDEHDQDLTEDVSIYDDEDDDDFKAPTPFVRAYRKAEPPTLTVSRGNSKESLNSIKSDKSKESLNVAADSHQKSKVKSLIRNSIRRLMHSSNKNPEKENQPVEHHQPTKIMDTIRHSLRRKPQKQQTPQHEDEEEPIIKAAAKRDISIIDRSERTMKLKTNLLQTDYMKIEELTTEKKHSLRSSIRKSTREVRNHIMKSVFHKNQEEYAFRK